VGINKIGGKKWQKHDYFSNMAVTISMYAATEEKESLTKNPILNSIYISCDVTKRDILSYYTVIA